MRKLLGLILMLVLGIVLISCAPSEMVQHNIAKDAEAFNVYRKATVINLISDTVMLEIEGYFSMERAEKTGALAIVIKEAPGTYKMHYIYLGDTIHILTLVEQLENTNTDPYHWKIRIYAVIPEIETKPDK